MLAELLAQLLEELAGELRAGLGGPTDHNAPDDLEFVVVGYDGPA